MNGIFRLRGISAFSPVHCEPPNVSSFDYNWAVYVNDAGMIDNSVIPKGEPVHERSRGPHEPGDGNYLNRYAFPSEDSQMVHVSGKDWRLVTGSSCTFDWKHDYNPVSDEFYNRELWDGKHLIILGVAHRDRRYILTGYVYLIRQNVGWWYGSPEVYYKWWSAFLQIGWDDEITASDACDFLDHWFGRFSTYEYSNPGEIPAPWDHWSSSYDSGTIYQNYWVHPADATLSNDWADIDLKLEFLPHTHIGTLEAEAYRKAVDELPHAGMNNIANIAELVSLISRMLFSGGLTAIGTANDAWLAYRYSYGTTKSDVQELCAMLDRLASLAAVFAIHARSVVHDDDLTVRCSIQLSSDELAKVYDFASKWGLKLTSYNMWDMIPYSFIVDWFLDVGSLLERGESIKIAYNCKKPAWFSIERDWVNEFSCREIDYYRHYAVPNLSEAYLYRVVNDPSGVTIVKRAIDALALVR